VTRGLGETIQLIRAAHSNPSIGENVETIRDNDGLSGILNAVDASLRQYVHFTFPEQSWAITLWIAHTWIADKAHTSPRLAITAPTKQSGKTRTLEVMAQLCRESWSVIGPSEAVMYRKIERDHPTILLDEADRLFEKRAEDVAGIVQVVNAGHSRGAVVPRVVGTGNLKLQDFEVYTPVAIAGIGTNWPDTILDRSIVIVLERKVGKDEAVERFRQHVRWLPKQIGDQLGEALADVESLSCNDLPPELSDRAQDNWEALLAIAQIAGRKWPERARRAAVKLSAIAAQIMADDDRIEVQLLADVAGIFENDPDHDFIGSKDLHDRLIALEDRPWGDWKGGWSTDRQGKLMRKVGAGPVKRPMVVPAIRGYERKAVMAAHRRIGHVPSTGSDE
jgi:hypothetical protein